MFIAVLVIRREDVVWLCDVTHNQVYMLRRNTNDRRTQNSVERSTTALTSARSCKHARSRSLWTNNTRKRVVIKTQLKSERFSLVKQQILKTGQKAVADTGHKCML